MNCFFVHVSSTFEFGAMLSDCLVQFSIANPSPWSDSQEYMITYNQFKVLYSPIMVALLPTLGCSHSLLVQLDLFSGLLNHLRSKGNALTGIYPT